MSDQDMESMTTAPGFRFHPTDEELVSYYLKRKICGKGFRFDAISEVDVYKNEPWDLSVKSKLKSKDLEWYFFSMLDKKYGCGARTARTTEKGYWKTTGKDRAVSHKSNVVGMKKTLVYHSGRAPRGKRTNYVMHEYRLIDEKLAKAGVYQDAFVLCRIFLKTGSGLKNGEKYGAPLVEEEWEEEDELIPGPSKEVVEEAVGNDDHDIYLDSSDLEQIFNGKVPVELSFCYGDSNSQIQETPIQGNYHNLEKESENQHCSGLQIQNPMDVKTINEKLVGETSLSDLDFLLDEPFFDAVANDSFDNVAFLEPDDALNTFKVDSSGVDMVGEYLSFVNADQDTNFQFTPFDSSNLGESENLAADQAFFNPELINEGAEEENIESHQLLLEGYNDDAALVSKQKPENDDSGGKYSFVKKASQMLGSVSAPPALASEFPSEELALRLSSASRSLVHLSAGMIQIQKPRTNGTKTSWVLGKNLNISVFLSFGLSHNNADSSLNFQQPPVSEVLTKATPALLRCMMYLMFFWVLILSVTCKIGSCFCSGDLSS